MYFIVRRDLSSREGIHASEESASAKRAKAEGKLREKAPSSRLSPVPLSVNSLSPVLPSLDVTDRRG